MNVNKEFLIPEAFGMQMTLEHLPDTQSGSIVKCVYVYLCKTTYVGWLIIE